MCKNYFSEKKTNYFKRLRKLQAIVLSTRRKKNGLLSTEKTQQIPEHSTLTF